MIVSSLHALRTTPHSKWRCKKKDLWPHQSNSLISLGSNNCTELRREWGWFRYIQFVQKLLWHQQQFVTKFRCSNFLYSNCIKVFVETKSFVNKHNIYIYIIFIYVFNPCDSHLSKNIAELLWYCVKSFFLQVQL